MELHRFFVFLFTLGFGYFIGSVFRGPAVYESQISSSLNQDLVANNIKIHVTTNPRGAESLPPDIIEPYSEFYLRDIIGNLTEDLVYKPKYLLALTVGFPQKDIIDNVVSKFSRNFSIVLFHYDGRTSEWDQFEWSKRAIHVSARKQTKWWYAKRFLHPDIIASYEYIFVWDEDIGVHNFNAEEYIKITKKYDLEISQPAVVSKKELTWPITQKRDNVEAHKHSDELDCKDNFWPPCSGFVEIMAPVFSRTSWRCVWRMLQNDLVHGWGIDFALWRCSQKSDQNIGVVDAQWIEHMTLPSLGDQGTSINGSAPWIGVRKRCHVEWAEFDRRMEEAEQNKNS